MVERRKLTEIQLQIGITNIGSREEGKYQGVMFDRNRMESHVTKTEKKVESVRSLNGILPNIGGPDSGKKKLIAAVAYSNMLYSASVWDKVLRVKKYRDKL